MCDWGFAVFYAPPFLPEYHQPCALICKSTPPTSNTRRRANIRLGSPCITRHVDGSFLILCFLSSIHLCSSIFPSLQIAHLCSSAIIHVALNPGAPGHHAERDLTVAKKMARQRPYPSGAINQSAVPTKVPGIVLHGHKEWRIGPTTQDHACWAHPRSLSGMWLDFSQGKPCSLHQVCVTSNTICCTRPGQRGILTVPQCVWRYALDCLVETDVSTYAADKGIQR